MHGTRSNDQNELWSYGADAQKILTSYDRLRYRLMPYIYSMAWMVTNSSYTPMRALAMDFRSDPRALNIGDQFMFGPALLVSPVTEPGADYAANVFAEGNLVRLLDGTQTGWREDASTPLLPSIVFRCLCAQGRSFRWVPICSMPPKNLPTRLSCASIAARMERSRSTRTRTTATTTRKGVYATIPIRWDDASQTLDHRRAQRQVSRHAGKQDVPRRVREREPWRWDRHHAAG